MSAQQGTAEWLQEKCGYASASEFAAIVAKGDRIGCRKYMRQIVAERLTGKPIENRAYGNWQKNLDRGKEQEPLARAAYEEATGNLVEQVGFIKHQMIMAGCSPDGLIGSDGGCEIKSVIPTKQLDTILAGKCPTEHIPQVQGGMWITERKWWDFCSFSPDLPENLRLYIFRVERDEAYIATLQTEVISFLLECKELEDKLRGRIA